MAWIQAVKRKDGTCSYWIRDIRNGRQIVLAAGDTRGEAELNLDHYEIRKDLEKEGYDDAYTVDCPRIREITTMEED